jgi:hypothetical protein
MAASSRLGSYNIGHLYMAQAPDRPELEPTDLLYYGVHLLSLYESKSDLGLEIETMAGKRVLLVLGRSPNTFLPSDARANLRVIDLAAADDVPSARENFFKQVKKHLNESVANIRQGSVEARPGEYCDRCDYGELCRRSKRFGDEDSLFGEASPEEVSD